MQSRLAILSENYVKTVNVEAKLTTFMAKTMILPAALRYQNEVAHAVNATKAAGVDNAAQADMLRNPDGNHHRVPEGDGGAGKGRRPSHGGRAVGPRQATRATRCCRRWRRCGLLGDHLEGVVADDLWPLPTYREMLFIK